MAVSKTNVILHINSRSFLRLRWAADICCSSSFHLCKSGWMSSWINISRCFLRLFLFLPNSAFFSKNKHIEFITHNSSSRKKIIYPPLGWLLWNCIIWQQLVAFNNASHMLIVLRNTIYLHNIPDYLSINWHEMMKEQKHCFCPSNEQPKYHHFEYRSHLRHLDFPFWTIEQNHHGSL